MLTLVGKNLSRPWNKGLLVGQKKPLQPKHVWSIRVRLEISCKCRDLALFNLAIDKLRACDLITLRLDEVCSGAKVRVPTKPAMHSNLKPAGYSDRKPATLDVNRMGRFDDVVEG